MKNPKKFSLCVAAFAFAIPSVASAQSTEMLDSRERQYTFEFNDKLLQQLVPYEYRSEIEQEEAFYVANSFARCAIKLDEKGARALLDKTMFEGVYLAEEQDYYDRLRGCAIKYKLVDREFMRGSLARHVLLRHEKMAEVQSAITEAELIDFLKSVEVTDKKFVRTLTSTQVGYQCRAAMVPDIAYAVLENEPNSKREASALRRLEEATPYCDALFKDEEPSLWFKRAFLARGLYHWNQYRDLNETD